MTDVLESEKAYLTANQTALAAQYPGKFLLIKDNAVHGAFETYEQGVTRGAVLFGAGPFLVRSPAAVGDADSPSIPALSIGIPLIVHSYYSGTVRHRPSRRAQTSR